MPVFFAILYFIATIFTFFCYYSQITLQKSQFRRVTRVTDAAAAHAAIAGHRRAVVVL